MFIENVAATDIATNNFRIPSANSILIQISSMGDFPVTNFGFREIHQFIFMDIDAAEIARDADLEDFAITQTQASEISLVIRRAISQGMDVVVHCHAGTSRSGAVTEFAVGLGMQSVHNNRIPNEMVLSMLINA